MPRQMKSTAIICSSPEHFIRNCPLMKAVRDKKQLNGKEGTVMVKGAWTPPKPSNALQRPPNRRLRRCIETSSQTPFMNPDPFQ